MAYTLACKDAGQVTCPFVARGETKDEVFAEAAKHAKEVHGYTDEKLSDPKLIEQMKAIVKEA
jgi:predicted small metal-binding protein